MTARKDRRVYEAQVHGSTLDRDGKYIAVPVMFKWHRDNPAAVTLTIKQPPRLGPTREWVFALQLLRDAFSAPRGLDVGEGNVSLVVTGVDLHITFTEGNQSGILVLQAGAIGYILNHIGLPPIEEEAVIATEIDILLYGIQHPEGTDP